MLRTVKILKTFSSILFIAALLLTYSYTVGKVNVYLDMEKVNLMNVGHLFFYALGVFALVNVLFLIFDRFLMKYRARKVKSTKVLYSDKFRSWLQGFNAAINLFLACSIGFIGFLNADADFKLLEFTFLLYIGPVAILITLFTLPLVFIPGKKTTN